MNDLILNQTQIPRDRLRYGLRSSAKTGCGWIALYNALVLLGEPKSPETLIDALERQLPLIHGSFGTFCLGPALLLRKWGYDVHICSDVERFDRIVRQADAALLYYYWHEKHRLGAHFVALHATAGGFTGYNTYVNSTGPDPYGDSLARYIKRQKYFGCVLTAVRKKKD